jgi:hypothetical protein
MDCVNHSGVAAAAYCQNCGKPLCGACVRTAPGGQIQCEPCWTAWHSAQQPFQPPYGPGYGGGPSPAVAAALGFIPGVGAMYNGQFIKGLIHVFVFAVLVSTAGHYGIFGLFIAAWVIYQVFEAYHVAKARRDGQPLPDPLGLNEISNWVNPGGRAHHPPVNPVSAPPGAGPYQQAPYEQGPYQPGPYQAPSQPQPPYQEPQWQNPYQGPASGPGPYQAPYAGPAPGPGVPNPGFPNPGFPNPGFPNPGFPAMPPVPPPMYWKRREPVGAVILIALGVLFLLGRMDIFSGRLFEFSWPLLLIGLGVWLFVRRYQEASWMAHKDSQDNSQGNPQGGPK